MGKHLVLVGGGHAHMVTLAGIGQIVDRGHRVTVIGPSEHHYYSGMGPGMLSGIYRPEETRFNIRRMILDRAGAFLQDRVVAVRPDEATSAPSSRGPPTRVCGVR